MKFLISIALFLCLSACYPIKRLAYLPPELNENSGLLIRKDTICLHNDSGGEAALYLWNAKDGLFHRLSIQGASNVDWEDLCEDQAGNIYIGDFGNNLNQRKNLCIYKIAAGSSLSQKELFAEKIEFYYPEQKTFPAAPTARDFDMEAMIAFNDSLYLFSKNRTKPNDGWVKLYRLPQQAGRHKAILQDSFKIKRGRFRKSITAAAISKSGKTLALLSMGKLRIFKDFEGTDFFNAKIQQSYPLFFTQKEAIDFKTEEILYLSDEKSPLGKAKLYQIRLKKTNRPKK